jgi:hypothetical protein
MSGDVNAILRAWLVTQPTLTALVGGASPRVYCPRLPEGAVLPAIGFFVRGGVSTPYIPPVVDPSFQFDCWAPSPIAARAVYSALYDALQGLQGETVTIGTDTYRLLGAREEVSGQDVQSVEDPGYHRVIAFFSIKIQI